MNAPLVRFSWGDEAYKVIMMRTEITVHILNNQWWVVVHYTWGEGVHLKYFEKLDFKIMRLPQDSGANFVWLKFLFNWNMGAKNRLNHDYGCSTDRSRYTGVLSYLKSDEKWRIYGPKRGSQNRAQGLILPIFCPIHNLAKFQYFSMRPVLFDRYVQILHIYYPNDSSKTCKI